MTLIRGVDVSAYQTVSSWSSLARSVDFVIVKATESTGYVSKTFRTYYAGARSAGILRGSYHFAHPANNPVTEARFYARTLKAAGFVSGRDLPPVLDIERTDGKGKAALTAWCLSFLREVDAQLGLKEPWLRCGVYTNNDYRRNRFDGAKVLDGRWLWLAAWPDRNGGWPADDDRPTGAALWQWTDRARVSGIRENTDANVARAVDLRSLAPTFYGATAPAPDRTAPLPEEDPLAGITLDQIRAVVRDEVRYHVRPGPSAQRIAGDYSKELIEEGAAVAAYAVGADARTRALVKAVEALAEAQGPAVLAAVREALADAVVNVNVDVNGVAQ